MHLDIQLIRHCQHTSGAYPACPTFSQYPYSWLRDGSFIAYAMDRVGVHASARAFHLWAARTLEAQGGHVTELLRRAGAGEAIPPGDFLPTRFALDGGWRQDGWPNFQLDGYGQWLWSLSEHLRLTGERELPEVLAPAVELAACYLTQFWSEPCFDAWEEFPARLHTSTLASLYGGLTAIARFRPEARKTAEEIKCVMLEECVTENRFVKFVKNPAVDASLLWVSTPFAVVSEDDPRMQATVTEIERSLLCDGGVLRYTSDTYFGGGAWVLLTAWLGWYHARRGNVRRTRELLAWIDGQRDAFGCLPEQVAVASTNVRFLDYWRRQWGPVARPLLWSHAMYLVLATELKGRGQD
jgi:GH15 family glucan-1,4-alpha-glucosidase